MSFAEKLATLVGLNVQVILTVDTIIGQLVSVNDTVTVIRTNVVPGYGPSQDVTVLTNTISYVRVA
jgi:hypothetical protein